MKLAKSDRDMKWSQNMGKISLNQFLHINNPKGVVVYDERSFLFIYHTHLLLK